MDPQLQRLFSLPLSRGPLLVFTHENPDPDSLASAAALKFLLATKGVHADVVYSGIIGRAENRVMAQLLELPVRELAEVDPSDYAHFALVDAQPLTGNNSIPRSVVPDIVIDHHPLREETRRSPFFDVREDVGASATILTEYLFSAGVGIPPDLATALLYGIRSETRDLGREAAESDLRAYEKLLPLADMRKLAIISTPPLPRHYYSQLAKGLASLRVTGQVSVCFLGEVIDPDFVAEMADLAIRMEGVHWTLASGEFRGRIYLSIRTNAIDEHAGEMMQRVLEGFGSGGGHGMRAGGNIEVAALQSSRQELHKLLAERFLRFTGSPQTGLPAFLEQIDGESEIES